MNILLVYPEIPATFWSFRHLAKFVRPKAVYPPLGLLTVAAMLPKEWNKRLVDMNVSQLTDEDLHWADYVFISAMAVQRDSAYAVTARCRQAGVKIVCGGPLFAAEYENFTDVDHFVLHEAEITFPPFLADLAKGEAKRVYTANKDFADLTETPTPLWELIDFSRYHSLSLQFSRGCPFNCEFCNVTALFGHRTRVKAVKQVIDELDTIYNHGWRGQIFFVDDNLMGNKKALKTGLLPALIEWRKGKAGIEFSTQISINLADDERLMQLMKEATFNRVFIGIESPDDNSLAEVKKNHNCSRDLVENVKTIHRNGMQVQAGFIVGFDNDTPSIFQRQIELIQNSGIVIAMVGILQAVPGTVLYQRMKKEGRLLEEIWRGDGIDATTNIQPRMNAQTLRDGYLAIVRTIYAPRNYYQRIKTLLRDFHPPKLSAFVTWEEVRAFYFSIIHQGILSRERFLYWNLLIWTILHRPSLLPTAIRLAIYGYHFSRVTGSMSDSEAASRS